MRIASLLLIVAACVPLPGAAQRISGIVVEQGTGTPVPGAMVRLFDSADTQVDLTLTDVAGRFVVRASAPGAHHVTVERIGYADWSTDPFRARAAGTLLTIEVPLEAISLEGIHVSGEERCEVRPVGGEGTARVWEEARKALAAEEFTREAELYRYTLRRYTRALDRNARNILSEQIATARHQQAAFVSLPIERLTSRGFVQPADDSTNSYYAPDAGALLSDAFLDTHCFGLREGEGGRIGLTFQPLPDRRVPEISGVLWLNAATSELERLEFLYRNLLPDPELGEPGGEVTFTRLPNGAWIVRAWAIRMPDLELVVRGRIRRLGYKEVGGITWAITDARGRTLLHAESASISGVVTDSLGTGPPPERVVVEVRGTTIQAATEEDGSFLLAGLEEGHHVLVVQRPLLANMGLGSPAVLAVEGRLGEVADVRLRVPTVADALVSSCGGTPRPEGTTAFLGRIGAPGGAPMDRMTVAASWARASGYTAPAIAAPVGPEGTRDQEWDFGRDSAFVTATTTTDWRGFFLLCDVPGGSRVRVAVRGPADSEPVLTETFFVDAGSRAVVETLIVPVGNDRPTQFMVRATRNPK